jgi:hypothetical protein
MSSSELESLPDSHWRRFYEAAILEVDPSAVSPRIQMAKGAIHSCIIELYARHGDVSELWALMHALNVLKDLVRIQEVPV